MNLLKTIGIFLWLKLKEISIFLFQAIAMIIFFSVAAYLVAEVFVLLGQLYCLIPGLETLCFSQEEAKGLSPAFCWIWDFKPLSGVYASFGTLFTLMLAIAVGAVYCIVRFFVWIVGWIKSNWREEIENDRSCYW